MKYFAIIPARKGSKEVPGKNIKSLAGKPLICWTIEQALKSRKISQVIVSTDCKKIAKISKDNGAEVPFLRPLKYAKDNSTTESALLHAVDNLKLKKLDKVSIILLQPTSPIRLKGSIDKAINKFEKENADSLVSVNPTKNFYWRYSEKATPLYSLDKRLMRQKLKKNDIIFKENGSIYITKLNILLKENNRLGGKITIFEMKDEEGIEIDSLEDFLLAKNQIVKINNFKMKIQLSEIDAIIFDFDGVLTDNHVYLSSNGEETVRCNRSDGHTFNVFKKLNLKTFILSSEKNDVVKRRGEKLDIKTINGSIDKKKDLIVLSKKYNLNLNKTIYVANDLNDLEAMKCCGFSFAVNDAVEEVKKHSDFVLSSKGGGMVAREILNKYIDY